MISEQVTVAHRGDKMERLDVDRPFRLLGKPEDKVAGRLKFDPIEGTRLRLGTGAGKK